MSHAVRLWGWLRRTKPLHGQWLWMGSPRAACRDLEPGSCSCLQCVQLRPSISGPSGCGYSGEGFQQDSAGTTGMQNGKSGKNGKSKGKNGKGGRRPAASVCLFNFVEPCSWKLMTSH